MHGYIDLHQTITIRLEHDQTLKWGCLTHLPLIFQPSDVFHRFSRSSDVFNVIKGDAAPSKSQPNLTSGAKPHYKYELCLRQCLLHRATWVVDGCISTLLRG